jgi:hypothetical protein
MNQNSLLEILTTVFDQVVWSVGSGEENKTEKRVKR